MTSPGVGAAGAIADSIAPDADDGLTCVDLRALFAGGLPMPAQPTVLRRSDGCGLFYRETVNSLYGDSESGKSWLCYCAVAQVLADGGVAVVVDSDHNLHSEVARRLLQLGAEREHLEDRNRFRLYSPEDRDGLLAAVRESVDLAPDLAVVDSVGEVLPMLGLSSNQPDEFTSANRIVMRPLSLVGAAVVAIDHLPKSPEVRRAGPTGTAAKRRTVGGTSVRMTLRRPFVSGQGGEAALSISKDRPGGLRAVSPVVPGHEQPCGLFTLDSRADGGLSWDVTAPLAGDVVSGAELTGQDARVPTVDEVAALQDLPVDALRTVRDLSKAMSWNYAKAGRALKAYRGET